jgi:hypothetical protein
MNKGFSRKPKATGPRAVDEFIAAAGRPAENAPTPPAKKPDEMTPSQFITEEPESYSWQGPRVRDDVQKVYNLRLPEPYLLKLKYIAEHTPRSMQRFCLDALLPAIDAEIEALIQRKG